jgi:hypothetical protein
MQQLMTMATATTTTTTTTTTNSTVAAVVDDKKESTTTTTTMTEGCTSIEKQQEHAQQKYRELPIMSEIVFFPVILLYACLHWTLSPFPKLEGVIGMLIMGGYFAIFLIPTFFYWMILKGIEYYVGIPFTYLYYGIVLPFMVTYIVLVLILDKSQYIVENSSTMPACNFIEQGYMGFSKSSVMDYHPSNECIPWCEHATLDPNGQYIFGVHPHGIHPFPLMHFTTPDNKFDQQFPGIVGNTLTGVAASVIFHLPVVRELFFHMGYIDANRKTCADALAKGKSLHIVVGGEEESMYTTQGQDIVVLKKRKGFIRLALSYGVDLVPVFGVGNTDTYKTYNFGLKYRLWFQKKFGVALPVFHGRCFTPLPYPVSMKILIGKPIKTPKPQSMGSKPDDRLVDEYHAKYVEALKEMHAKHVHDRTLIVR